MASALVNDFKEMVSEQVEYRDLLYQMTKRDLLLRYKQTAMGFGWAVFTPLVNTAVFSVIFTRVAPIDTVVPYPVFAYLRAPGLELLLECPEVLGQLAHFEHEFGHQSLFSA